MRFLNKYKSIMLIFVTCAVYANTTAFGSVIGDRTGGWQTDMGGGAVYSNNVFESSSTKQTENYVEYTPNSQSVPIVVNGASVYGTRTISSASQYMEQNNLRPLIGINGDYFSTKTGIPMGYTVIDNRIWSKESGMQDAIGIREDGTAFIDKIGIDTTLSKGDDRINIQYINKWAQKGFSWVYMLDDNFSDTTKSNFNALYVICSAVDGELSVSGNMGLKVDEVFIYDGSIKIPKGKYVFVMDVNGDKKFFDFLANLAPGDELTLTNSVYGTDKNDWTQAKYIMSTIGGRLLDNGTVGSGLTAGTAPRTAVGIKADGNIIFYTVDGRQTGHSTGLSLTTLAKRMQELGCVDAINFDGGGSTVIGGIFPGMDDFIITNKPSDGRERRCANYLFLKDLREKTDILWHINWQEKDNYNYLSGSSCRLNAVSAYDTGNYRMEKIPQLQYIVENSGTSDTTVDENGLIRFSGTGQVKVTVTGGEYSKTFIFESYEEPDEIRIIDESTGKEINELVVYENGMTNYDLEAGAYVNNVRLESEPGMFKWISNGSCVSVNENGVVSIKDDGTKSASVVVSVGSKTKEIPVRVVEVSTFADTNGHWAYKTIEKMAREGIINGFEENGKKLFKPDMPITRAQFSAIIVKSMGIDTGDFANVNLNFTDNAKIQPWALEYIRALVGAGYISGKSDDEGRTQYFAPDDYITRAEAFTILGRIVGEQNGEVIKFNDSADIADWAVGGINALVNMGVINGYEDNTIRPNNTISRAESSVLLDNFSQKR